MAFDPSKLGSIIYDPNEPKRYGGFDPSLLGEPITSEPTLAEKTWASLGELVAGEYESARQKGLSAITRGAGKLEQEFQPQPDESALGAAVKRPLRIAGAVGETALGTAAGGVQALFAPLTGIIQKGIQATGLEINQDHPIIKNINQWVEEHPDAARNLTDAISVGGALLGSRGLTAKVPPLRETIEALRGDITAGAKTVTRLPSSIFSQKTDDMILATPQSQLYKLSPSEQHRYFKMQADKENAFFKSEIETIAPEETTRIAQLNKEHTAALQSLQKQRDALLSQTKKASVQKTAELQEQSKALLTEAQQASAAETIRLREPTRQLFGRQSTQWRDITGRELSGKGDVPVTHNELKQFIEEQYPARDQYGNVSNDAANIKRLFGIREEARAVAGEVPTRAITTEEQFNALPLSQQEEAFAKLERPLQDRILGLNVEKTPVQQLADDIASGKQKVRAPKSIKTDVHETLGQGNYARIFRTKETAPSIQSLDELANSVGVSDTELVQEIRSALDARAGAQTIVGEGQQLPKSAFKTTIKKLYDKTLALGQDIGRAAKSGTRTYTPDEITTDKAIRTLVEFMKTKGVDMTEARAFWRDWAPVRDKFIKNIRPFDTHGLDTQTFGNKLVAVASGDTSAGVHNANLVKMFEEYLGEPIGVDVQKAVAALNANEAKILAVQAKAELDMEAIRSSTKTAQTTLQESARAGKADIISESQQAKKTLTGKHEAAQQGLEAQQFAVAQKARFRIWLKKVLSIGIPAGAAGEVLRRTAF